MTSLPFPAPSPIPDRFKDQVVIVTGAAGNIGLETVRRFLQEGAKVTLVDKDKTRLESARGLLSSVNPEGVDAMLYIQADVTSEPDVKSFVDQTVKHFGRLDAVFLSAGLSYSTTSILETSVEQYDLVMEVNCRSSFLGVKHCGRAMRDLGNPGSIILASSASGLRATPGLTAYSMAKFALRGLCLTAAAELGKYGIRVNTIHPSGVNTPMFMATWPEEERKSMLERVPLGRWSNVEDVAAVVCYLASKDAQLLTGGALKIDGGSVTS